MTFRSAGLLTCVGLLVAGAGVVWVRHRRPAPAAEAAAPVTFSRDIAPIVYQQCAGCHHAGGSGPFDLLTFADVHKRAAQIAKVTGSRIMPPWLPDRSCGPFMGQLGLSDGQIELFRRWAATGGAEGDPASAPSPPHYPTGWALGEPDLVLTLADTYVLPAAGTGGDVYRNFVLPLSPDSSRFVRAVELRPGNARVVHHTSLLLDPGGTARRRAAAEGGTSYSGMSAGGQIAGVEGQLMSWQPGKLPCIETADQPWRLAAGTDIVLQMHLRPTGKPEPVRPSLGLYFTNKSPSNPLIRVMLRTTAIDIPAGAADYAISSYYQLPVDAEVVVVNAHAHYLGKDLQGYAILPDGSRRTLLSIPGWDFNWQGTYTFVTPVKLPRGTTLAMRYTYDNSAANPRNPSSPPKQVIYGPNSDDEMGEFWLLLHTATPQDSAALTADYQRRYLSPDTIPSLQNFLKRTPNSADLHADLAGALLNFGRTDEAVREAQAALAINADCARAHRCLGAVYFRRHDYDRATAEYRLAVKADSGDSASMADLGLALGCQNQFPEAVEQLQASLQINPRDALTHTNLARVYVLQGKPAEARSELLRALKLDPDQSLAQETLRSLNGK